MIAEVSPEGDDGRLVGAVLVPVALRVVVQLVVEGRLAGEPFVERGERLALVGATPPATLLGVTRLAVPGMAVEIDVTAAR